MLFIGMVTLYGIQKHRLETCCVSLRSTRPEVVLEGFHKAFLIYPVKPNREVTVAMLSGLTRLDNEIKVEMLARMNSWDGSAFTSEDVPNLLGHMDRFIAADEAYLKDSTTDDTSIFVGTETVLATFKRMGPDAKAALPAIEAIRPTSRATHFAKEEAIGAITGTERPRPGDIGEGGGD